MFHSIFSRLRAARLRRLNRAQRHEARTLNLETLEVRQVPAVVTNPASKFNIIVDGQFTGSSVNPSTNKFVMGQEWSDVTPLGFHSPTTTDPTFRATSVTDPTTNSLLYVSLDPGGDEVYLMYDYLPRTDQNFVPGTTAGTVSFPINQINPDGSTTSRVIDVIFQANGNVSGGGSSGGGTAAASAIRNAAAVIGGGGNSGGGSSFNVLVRFEDDGTTVEAAALGFEGAAGFGPSTLSTTPHLLTELGVPLDIPAGFSSPGSVIPPGGDTPPNGYGYSPDPRFWGAAITNNAADPAAGSALFQIMPNGSVRADSSHLVTQVVNFDINKGNSAKNPIVLHGDGRLRGDSVVTVTVLSTTTFDATTINLRTVRLSDPRDSDDAARPFAEQKVKDATGKVIGVKLLFWGEDVKEAVNSHTKTLALTGKTTTGVSFGGSELVYILNHDHDHDHDRDHGHDR